MKISITSQGEARLFLSREDMHRYELCVDAFEKESDETRLFISCITAFLTELGLIKLDDSELVCTVTEVCDGMIVSIGSQPKEKDRQTDVMLEFDDPAELTQFCLKLDSQLLAKLKESELFKLDSSYFLIMKMMNKKQELRSSRCFHSGIFDSVLIQKTREYARLLSHTPVETIRKLTDP